jgi:hypothetical protein
MAKSDKKFKELILLICTWSEHDPKFGAIKLNKILFHSDFSAYLTYGEAITGEEYFKLKNGPAPRRMLPMTKKMEASGEFAFKEVEYHGFKQKRPIALRPPDIDVFTSREVGLVHKTIAKYWKMSASEISLRSHGFLGWMAVREKETIPYSTALVGTRKPTEAEIAYGLELQPMAAECLARVRR